MERFCPVVCSSLQPDRCPMPDGRHHWRACGSLPPPKCPPFFEFATLSAACRLNTESLIIMRPLEISGRKSNRHCQNSLGSGAVACKFGC